ncbi:MAG: SUMF1/EgtB/PvdO family nonheme iron enzyme, partial [Gammaproteobacteria bacterium]|nr:SUMF1/EgtB/PvdO family nonheme iron enzyme [Gammaproteobacteria bacterium]
MRAMAKHWGFAAGCLVRYHSHGNKPNVERRVLRGGSWNNNPRRLRSANRNNNEPTNRNNNVG